jgi:hypothetical protein
VEGDPGADAMQLIGTVSGCANKLSYADDMQSCLFLGVRILDKHNLIVWLETFDFGKLDEVIDPLSTVLEMETGVLKSIRSFDDGLAHILDLLLICDRYCLLVRLVWKLHGNLEQRPGIGVILTVVVLVVVLVGMGVVM